MQKAYGPVHPNLASVLTSIGSSFLEQRRFVEAEPYFRRALGIFGTALGEDNPTTVIGDINLAHALVGQKRFAEALRHAAPSLEFAQRELPPEHPVTVHALLAVGGCQLGLDRVRESLQSLGRAERLVDKVDAETAALVRFALARALWQSGEDCACAVALAERVRTDAEARGNREALAEGARVAHCTSASGALNAPRPALALPRPLALKLPRTAVSACCLRSEVLRLWDESGSQPLHVVGSRVPCEDALRLLSARGVRRRPDARRRAVDPEATARSDRREGRGHHRIRQPLAEGGAGARRAATATSPTSCSAPPS